MQCTWAEEESGFRFFLPNCMGGAVYGPNGCTCDRGGIDIDEALENAKHFEEQNRKLRSKIADLEAEIWKLKRG